MEKLNFLKDSFTITLYLLDLIGFWPTFGIFHYEKLPSYKRWDEADWMDPLICHFNKMHIKLWNFLHFLFITPLPSLPNSGLLWTYVNMPDSYGEMQIEIGGWGKLTYICLKTHKIISNLIYIHITMLSLLCVQCSVYPSMLLN